MTVVGGAIALSAIAILLDGETTTGAAPVSFVSEAIAGGLNSCKAPPPPAGVAGQGWYKKARKTVPKNVLDHMLYAYTADSVRDHVLNNGKLVPKKKKD